MIEEMERYIIKVKNSEDISMIKEDEHLKGYMFDSLVYRFKDYQARAFQAEVIDYKYTHNCSEVEAREKVKGRYDRDLMRFIDILDEAIGEHD